MSVHHRAWGPGALDAVAAALADGPQAVSGSVRRADGMLVVDPIALLTGSGVVVPDLTAPTRTRIDHGDDTRDPLTTVLDTATGVLADAAHHGLTHLPRGYGDRVRAAAAELDRVVTRCWSQRSHLSWVGPPSRTSSPGRSRTSGRGSG